jgi:glycolate oxidase FAD binding subunit
MAAIAPPSACRAATEADAVLGVRPRLVFSPETLEEAVSVMEVTERDGLRVVFAGGRTQISLGARPEGLDAVVETSRLGRILEHAPSDQIVVAEAGVTLSRLQAALAPHGQRLALDPPLPERATLGGIVAANAFGPLRARYGSVRDLLIGVGVVRADGTVARGGGKVVKNVAGFDIPKLMVGSLGSLAMIATTTFRLHPLPETSATVHLPGLRPEEARALFAALRAAQLEPAAALALAVRAADRLDVAVRFEGFAAGVEDQRDRLLSMVPNLSAKRSEVLEEKLVREFASRHDRARTSGGFRAKLAAPRERLGAVCHGVLAPLFSALSSPEAALYPTLGLGFVSADAPDARATASAVSTARDVLAGMGGSLVLEEAPATLRELLDVWGPSPGAIGLMKPVKERLDPRRRLAPGRLLGL